MGDIGAIGAIIEDIIYVVRYMNGNGELSDDNLKHILLVLDNINDSAIAQGIDLCIDEEYVEYIKNYLRI